MRMVAFNTINNAKHRRKGIIVSSTVGELKSTFPNQKMAFKVCMEQYFARIAI